MSSSLNKDIIIIIIIISVWAPFERRGPILSFRFCFVWREKRNIKNTCTYIDNLEKRNRFCF